MVRGTPLIGRSSDVANALSALARAGRCTIVGPGGVGKSSVAREVAASAGDRPVIWVDAEPIDQTDALLLQLLRQLGVVRLPGEASGDAVRSALDGSVALIVLDGVEHLGDELTATIATWPISPSGPWVLATSRRSLGASMLPLVRVDPLGIGAAGAWSPAAQMLIDEVAARGGDGASLLADPELFGCVLSATGGLPVAIQLTADHVGRFGLRFAAEQPATIDAVIDACIERTLTLLSGDDRRAFERLGLTAGSFTLDVVVACSASQSAAEAQALAARLVEHGLVSAADGRFDMLPPLRDGARALLERSGDADAALKSLLAWIVGVAAGSSDDEPSPTIAANLDTCVHVAWLALRHPGLHSESLELVNALFDPMYERLRLTELLTLLEAVLADGSLDTRGFAETARRAALCACECDTLARARQWLARAHELAAQLDDASFERRVWMVDAWLHLDGGDHAKAIEAAERSIALALPTDSVATTLASMRCIAEASLAMGDLDRAEAIAGRVLELGADSSPSDCLIARTTLGWCLVERGRVAEAVAHARLLANDIARRQADPSETAIEAELIAIAADPRIEPAAASLDNDHRFTWWMRLQQKIRLAARLPIDEHWEQVMHAAADAIVLADLVPLGYPRICATNLLGDAALAGDDLRQAARAYEQALRDAARGPYRLRGADAFDGIAVVAQRLGHEHVATSAAAAAAQIRERAGAAPWPRPSLPTTVTPAGAVPETWLRDGTPTQTAIDEITRALHSQHRPDPLDRLTHAELHVAQLVRRGLSNKDIADELVVSRRTVESHLARIFRKLDIRTRTQLATLPIRDPR